MDLPVLHGMVYGVENILTGKLFIGRCNLLERTRPAHQWNLRRGTHHNKALQADWNRFGEEAFVFRIVEDGLAIPEPLITRTYELIAYFRAHGEVYNHVSGGEPPAWSVPPPRQRT